ncbi:MAG: EAL domain-containing protein [Actinomycetia bacterium]|nr:EAL domain-containing protein [Actinomycetes bacterium]
MAGLWTWDPATDVVTWSGAVAELHGVPEPATTYADLLAAVHASDRASVDATWRGLAAAGGESGQVYRSGGGAMISAHAQRVDVAGRCLVVGTVAPVARTGRNERRFRELFRRFPVGMAILDDDGHFIEVNDALCQLLARSRGDLLGTTYDEVVHPDERADVVLNRERVIRQEIPVLRVERLLLRPDGSAFWGRVATTRVADHGGVFWLSSLEDVTARREAEERLISQALHDPLTGLPNRRLLLDRLGQALARSKRDGRDVAVLFLDLDHVKRINDSLGHDAGDELLATVSQRLLDAVRATDTVSRLGGDEFVVVCEQVHDRAELERVAQRVLDAVRIPTDIGGEQVVVTASVGVVTPLTPDDPPQDLLRAADAAMYRAKHGGRARYIIDQGPPGLGDGEQLGLETELRLAVETDQLVLHYQPIVRVDGSLDGLEALLRWNHPDRGLLLPQEFLGVGSQPDLGRLVTGWVLRRAIADALSWADDGLSLSINVPVDQLRHPGFGDQVATLLAASGLPPTALRIELLEDQLADTKAVAAEIKRLGRLGVRFAVDDFGTGYSSLAYLKRLPISVVKIDRSFVRTICEDPADASIVRAVLDACRATGRMSVAEGVETLAQLDLLRDLGCDAVQGRLAAPPAPLAQLRTLLAARRVDLWAQPGMVQA